MERATMSERHCEDCDCIGGPAACSATCKCGTCLCFEAREWYQERVGRTAAPGLPRWKPNRWAA